MMENRSPDDLVSEDWNNVLKRVVPLMMDEKFSAALEMVENFMHSEMDNELRSSVLGTRAQLKEDLGDLEGARADLQLAISMVGPSFSKYVNQCCLGEVSRKLGQHDQVVASYRAALRTCTESEIPGGAALKRFLDALPQQTLSDDDRTLCSQVARRSWALVGLAGEPDVANLQLVASSLMAREAGRAKPGTDGTFPNFLPPK
jgi:hypothetical protein